MGVFVPRNVKTKVESTNMGVFVLWSRKIETKRGFKTKAHKEDN